MIFGNAGSTLLGFLKHPIVVLGDKPISVMSLFAVMALLWGFSWLSRRTERFIHKALLYKDIDPGIKGSMETFSKYLVLIIGIMISMSSIGLNMNSLTAFWTVLGVGLGFGLQNITQNFISGIIILLERPIKKGDIVRIGQTSGRVLDIKARSTLILTRDDIVIVVPNSQFISEQVINESFSGHKIRLHLKVGVAYGSDVDLVTRCLLEVAREQEKVLKSPPPTVTLEDFGDSSLVFHLRLWSSELWFYDILLSEMRYEITRKFQANDIRIPFPQRDIYIKQGGWGEQHIPKSSS